jgi:hypothetical protein
VQPRHGYTTWTHEFLGCIQSTQMRIAKQSLTTQYVLATAQLMPPHCWGFASALRLQSRTTRKNRRTERMSWFPQTPTARHVQPDRPSDLDLSISLKSSLAKGEWRSSLMKLAFILRLSHLTSRTGFATSHIIILSLIAVGFFLLRNSDRCWQTQMPQCRP